MPAGENEKYVLETTPDGKEEYVLLETTPDGSELDVLENEKAILQENGTGNIYVLEDVVTFEDNGTVYHVDDEKKTYTY